MRELKFRAWNKKEKVMTSYFSLQEIMYEGDGYTYYTINNFILMQYTGLKDKNGKEIYEGDIMDGYEGRQVVKWSEDVGIGFGFIWEPVKEYSESITGFIDEYEVIGNIYENKELL